MRAVVQRVSSAQVSVDGQVVGRCGRGYLVLVAAGRESTEAQAIRLAERIAIMRILPDAEGKMNLSLADCEPTGEPDVLVVSQFTLYGDVWASRRPSFTSSAPYEEGKRLYEIFVESLRSRVRGVETGVFGASMDVTLTNAGPVTLILDA
jgi:D-tyrosyl-tRNA(Tyr) deacylase